MAGRKGRASHLCRSGLKVPARAPQATVTALALMARHPHGIRVAGAATTSTPPSVFPPWNPPFPLPPPKHESAKGGKPQGGLTPGFVRRGEYNRGDPLSPTAPRTPALRVAAALRHSVPLAPRPPLGRSRTVGQGGPRALATSPCPSWSAHARPSSESPCALCPRWAARFVARRGHARARCASATSGWGGPHTPARAE